MINVLLGLKGLLIGIIISLPVGPIGILCLRRMVLQGPLIGIASGLGAATADVLFAVVALAGLTFFTPLLSEYMIFIKIICSIILGALGFHIMTTHPVRTKPEKPVHNHKESYFSALALTLANPLTILSLTALLTGFGIDLKHLSNLQSFLISMSIFVGCSGWWIFLALATKPLHHTLKPTIISKINQAAGICIVLSAFFILFTAFYHP